MASFTFFVGFLAVAIALATQNSLALAAQNDFAYINPNDLAPFGSTDFQVAPNDFDSTSFSAGTTSTSTSTSTSTPHTHVVFRPQTRGFKHSRITSLGETSSSTGTTSTSTSYTHVMVRPQTRGFEHTQVTRLGESSSSSAPAVAAITPVAAPPSPSPSSSSGTTTAKATSTRRETTTHNSIYVPETEFRFMTTIAPTASTVIKTVKEITTVYFDAGQLTRGDVAIEPWNRIYSVTQFINTCASGSAATFTLPAPTTAPPLTKTEFLTVTETLVIGAGGSAATASGKMSSLSRTTRHIPAGMVTASWRARE